MKNGNRKAVLSLFGCCMSVIWAGYLAFGYPGMMGTYWQEKYDVGAAETGSVVTFMLFALAVSMFFSGRIHMKLGMRKCILIGTVFIAAGMLILMNGKSIYSVYIWGFVTNIGCSFTYGPGLITAQQWFPERRGLASGIVNFVFGISAAVLSPLWNNVMEAAGYEKLNLILLISIAGTNIIAMLFAATPDKTDGPEDEKAAQNDLTTGQALRTRDFWLIWIIWVFRGAAGISMVSLSKSYALSLGISGIAVLSAFNLVSGCSRIVVGALSDIIGGERIGVIAFAVTAAGYALLPYIGTGAAVMVIAGCVGFGFGTLFTVTGPIASGRFGLRYFGMIYGLIFTAYGFIGGILGPALSGMVLDITSGNYHVVFGYLAVFAFIGAALMYVLQRGRKSRA